MTEEEGKCEKCGKVVDTGMMFAFCKHHKSCELWPHGGSKETEEFAENLWEGTPHD